MPKAAEKAVSQPSVSSKLQKYLKKQPQVNISLRDIQQSLSNIGVSLSKRVIEEREGR